MTIGASFGLLVFYCISLLFVGLVWYALVIKHRTCAIRRNRALVSKTIVDYFRGSGSEVRVRTVSRDAGQRFVALVSGKSFKVPSNSHIVEMVLARHVRNVCGLELEKTYWCFPAERGQHVAAPCNVDDRDEIATLKGDDYFDQ